MLDDHRSLLGTTLRDLVFIKYAFLVLTRLTVNVYIACISRPQHVDWRYLWTARARLGVTGVMATW
jgi:hypothetical protein